MVLFESNCIILRLNTLVKTQNILFNPKNVCKITASENVCYLVNVSMEAIRLLLKDQDLHCLLKRLQKYFSRQQKHLTFVVLTLRVDKCEFQFIYTHEFHEMHAHLRLSNNLLTMLNLNQIINMI